MSNDTSDKLNIIYKEMLMKRSPIERFIMGCSMFDSAKAIVKSSIINQNPQITPQKMKEEIFLRFYGMDFDGLQKEKILEYLKKTNS